MKTNRNNNEDSESDNNEYDLEKEIEKFNTKSKIASLFPLFLANQSKKSKILDSDDEFDPNNQEGQEYLMLSSGKKHKTF